ncbi:TNF receptor-associated factor 4-like isoform X4 [Haemaphysalis longicornis]
MTRQQVPVTKRGFEWTLKMASDMKYQLKDFKGLSDGVLIPFEDEVKQELLCCTCNAASPMGLKDGKGHSFCLRCARVHTDSCNEFTCSLCGWQGQLNYMTTNTEEWETLGELAAACPNVDTECSFKGAFKDVLVHYKDCGLRRKVECSLCGYLQDRKALADHMRDECEKRVLECVFCDKDVEAWEKQKHEADCRQRPGSCQHCHEEFKTFAELEDVHYPQCCQMPVNCSFKSLGCGFVTRRMDMALHELGSIQHNAILVDEIDRLKEENKMLRESLVEQEKYMKSMEDVKTLSSRLENKTNLAVKGHTECQRRIKALEDNLAKESKKFEGRLNDIKDTLRRVGWPLDYNW